MGYKRNWTLMCLLVIFSFFTTIYLLNLFIGLLSMAIENTNNDESFLKLKGEILEASIDELQKFINKVQTGTYEKASNPKLSSPIFKIAKMNEETVNIKIKKKLIIKLIMLTKNC
ncbi:nudt9 protein [Gigaspora margarita]|uniref:Nudt9 protein n=1 Tax=Gigaspora margarita TaxID=4874 RepID=A0A8H3X1G0_GIGMA|nr:nudt9 protein [Gigaspora margarita]